MLSNAYFLAKYPFDTAESEPANNLRKAAKTNAILQILLILLTLLEVATLCQSLFDVRIDLSADEDIDVQLWMTPEIDGTTPTGLSCVAYVSKTGKVSKTLQSFGGLVLGCIKTNFCKKICV